MAKRLVCMLAALFLVAASVCTSAEGLNKINIRQVQPFNDALRVYVDMTDSDGRAIEPPQASKINTYIDGEKLMVQRVKRFSESGEGMAYIFLIDVSGSIGASAFNKIKQSTVHWAEKMSEKDRAAIVTFGNEAKIVRDYTQSSQEIAETVNNISNSDGRTMLYGGLEKALELIERTDVGIPKRKVVILLTDGINEYGGTTEDEIVQKFKEKTIPVYSVWNPGTRGSGERFVNRLTEATNGEKYNLYKYSPESIYDTLFDRLKQTLMIDLGYSAAYADEKSHNIKMSVWENEHEITDETECVLKKTQDSLGVVPTSVPGTAQTNESEGNSMSGINLNMNMIIIIAVILLVLAIIVVIIALISRNNKNSEPKYRALIGGNVYSQYDANTPKPMPPTPDPTPVGRVRNTSGMPVTMTEVGGSDVKKGFLSGELLVGRNPDCDIVISDSQTSGKHCRFVFENGNMLVEDLKSTNGTTLNGMTFVGKTKVNSGDMIMFGNKEYRITF